MASASGLCVVHGRVGTLEQQSPLTALPWEQRNADVCAQAEAGARDGDWAFQPFDQLDRNTLSTLHSFHASHEHCELVTSTSGHQVVLLKLFAQARRDFVEKQVPDVCPETRAHSGKAVEVHEQQRERLTRIAVLGEGLLKLNPWIVPQ